jgi:hypothetical protein
MGLDVTGTQKCGAQFCCFCTFVACGARPPRNEMQGQNTTPPPMLAQAPAAGSPMADGYKTPPCFTFPRVRGFASGPALAPVIDNFQDRLMVPKFDSGHSWNSPDFEPRGSKEPRNESLRSNGPNDCEPNQGNLADSKQSHLSGCGAREEVPAGGSTRKRSPNFISDVEDTSIFFRSDSIFGAFKCIKMRKQA